MLRRAYARATAAAAAAATAAGDKRRRWQPRGKLRRKWELVTYSREQTATHVVMRGGDATRNGRNGRIISCARRTWKIRQLHLRKWMIRRGVSAGVQIVARTKLTPLILTKVFLLFLVFFFVFPSTRFSHCPSQNYLSIIESRNDNTRMMSSKSQVYYTASI